MSGPQEASLKSQGILELRQIQLKWPRHKPIRKAQRNQWPVFIRGAWNPWSSGLSRENLKAAVSARIKFLPHRVSDLKFQATIRQNEKAAWMSPDPLFPLTNTALGPSGSLRDESRSKMLADRNKCWPPITGAGTLAA